MGPGREGGREKAFIISRLLPGLTLSRSKPGILEYSFSLGLSDSNLNGFVRESFSQHQKRKLKILGMYHRYHIALKRSFIKIPKLSTPDMEKPDCIFCQETEIARLSHRGPCPCVSRGTYLASPCFLLTAMAPAWIQTSCQLHRTDKDRGAEPICEPNLLSQTQCLFSFLTGICPGEQPRPRVLALPSTIHKP